MTEDADRIGLQKTICLEGNGQRPSHRGDGYIESDAMYTLNSIEKHAVYSFKEKERRIYDARGNGGGMISPTITGDHQDRITDYTAIIVECYAKPGFDRYVKQDISDTIRASGGDAGGGAAKC